MLMVLYVPVHTNCWKTPKQHKKQLLEERYIKHTNVFISLFNSGEKLSRHCLHEKCFELLDHFIESTAYEDMR